MQLVQGEKIFGVNVDAQTRCEHYHSALDIIAIKFKCCREWYSCFDCHKALTNHESQVWPATENDAFAIICGGCGYQLSIREYFDCDSICPKCARHFNPGCANHYHLYFEKRGC